jgi:hypothetical protein
MPQLESKECTKCQIQFAITADDFGFYKKMSVPAPNQCPECRFKTRAQYRNEMNLYNRTCELCNKSVISMYNPKSPYIIYCDPCWRSDKWDPLSYGRGYDLDRPFFDQLQDLVRAVPKVATYVGHAMGPNINSDYSNFAGANRDCYLVFNCGPKNENCSYSRGLMNSRDVFDSYYGEEAERAYESININKSAGIVFGKNTIECLDSWFISDASGCQNCFGCVNLRGKSYHFLNEPLSENEYEKRVNQIKGSYAGIESFRKKFEKFSLKFPRRENNNLKSVNCTGEYVVESKNVFDSFEVSHSEESTYLFSTKYTRDSRDMIGHGRNSELILEGVGVGISSRVIGSWWVENGENIEYSFAVRSSKSCVGCDAVKNGEYVILNKRYEKEEYEKIRSRIVDELKAKNQYGLFIPSSFAFFGYNETIAQDNMPLTKKEALAQGFRWEDDIQITTDKETIKPEEIPDHIKDVPDSILSEILACVSCKRNYKIIPAELQFYKQMILPIPRQCFFCRHKDRLRRRGLMKVFNRNCMKCEKQIKTSYPPGRPEIIYCVDCYQKEVI